MKLRSSKNSSSPASEKGESALKGLKLGNRILKNTLRTKLYDYHGHSTEIDSRITHPNVSPPTQRPSKHSGSSGSKDRKSSGDRKKGIKLTFKKFIPVISLSNPHSRSRDKNKGASEFPSPSLNDELESITRKREQFERKGVSNRDSDMPKAVLTESRPITELSNENLESLLRCRTEDRRPEMPAETNQLSLNQPVGTLLHNQGKQADMEYEQIVTNLKSIQDIISKSAKQEASDRQTQDGSFSVKIMTVSESNRTLNSLLDQSFYFESFNLNLIPEEPQTQKPRTGRQPVAKEIETLAGQNGFVKQKHYEVPIKATASPYSPRQKKVDSRSNSNKRVPVDQGNEYFRPIKAKDEQPMDQIVLNAVRDPSPKSRKKQSIKFEKVAPNKEKVSAKREAHSSSAVQLMNQFNLLIKHV